MYKGLVKFQFYSKNEMDSFMCIFQQFKYLIDFMLSTENQVKL